MRVFITGTGRCGTSTIYQALKHSSIPIGHETAAGYLGIYPYPNHWIEVSAQLSGTMALLQSVYPDSKWIHLIRSKEDCVKSLVSQCPKALDSWGFLYCQARSITIGELEQIASLYYDATNSLIASLLPKGNEGGKGKKGFTLHLEEIEDRWQEVWDWIGHDASTYYVGDTEAFSTSKAELSRKYNSGSKRGRDN